MKAWAIGAATLALAMVVAEARARAGGCSDSSSDGGSSDSGSSSSSDSSSDSGGGSYDAGTYTSSGSDPVPACVESSDVLGRQQCSGFGTWAMPRLAPVIRVESGVSVRSISLNRYSFGGEVDHGSEGSYQYRLVPDDVGADAALISADLRVLAGRGLYGGAELSIGGVSADEGDMVTTTSGNPGGGYRAATMQPTVQLHFAYGAVIGARVPAGRLSFGAELFAGGRTLQVAVASQLGACEEETTARDTRLVIEPRARVDAWVSPWFSVGAFAGTDLNARETRSFGVFLSGHSRAFDGGM